MAPDDTSTSEAAPCKVRIDGGPLHGNTYAIPVAPGATIRLKALSGIYVYQFSPIVEDVPVLHCVGPAPPLP